MCIRDRLGEDVAVAIVLAPGAEMTPEDLRGFLSDKLAKHKIPAQIWFRDEALPRNANGKFLKRELKAELVGS